MNAITLPFVRSPASAGFPSPAADYMGDQIRLEDILVTRPASTFIMRAQGNSMQGAGIQNGDLLVVDRSITHCMERIVVAILNGELLVKYLNRINGQPALLSAHPRYSPRIIREEDDFEVWGCVRWSLTQHD